MIYLCCAPRGAQSGTAAAHALLKYTFHVKYSQCFPEIKRTPNGKPYFPDCPDVHFSLSHSKTHVLCALSDHMVGADIESPRDISGRVLSFYSTPEESSQFEPLDLWVLKESYIKLFGWTLPCVRDVRFSRSGGAITSRYIGRNTPSGADGAPSPVISALYHIAAPDGVILRAALSVIGDTPPEQPEWVDIG